MSAVPKSVVEPTRAEVDALHGLAVLEFGASWCGICLGAQNLIHATLGNRPDVAHLKIEDGPGRPLGRSFQVKLWPTLVFLKNGMEVSRVVRPRSAQDIAQGLALL